mgnify:CR=1 FL=1
MVSVRRIVPTLYLLVSALALTAGTGCPVVSNRPAPGEILRQRDPELNREYLLYVPTSYHDERQWPLVVACHGTKPFDNASLQLDEWKGLAEERGFLVVAPELLGTSAPPPSPEVQIARQLEDEKAILSIVRTVRAARSVDETRIFLTGWSAGGYAVLFTGLRHPDVFRALAARQGNFDERFLEPTIPFLDRNQPIFVMYGNLDPLKDDAVRAVEWLERHDLRPRQLERTGAHRREPEPVYSFFVDVVRNHPWIRIGVEDDPTDPMRVRFTVRTSFPASRYLWDFGDGERSTSASPVHTYSDPSLYTVKVAVYTAGGTPFVRQVQLQIPRVRLGATPLPTPSGQ